MLFLPKYDLFSKIGISSKNKPLNLKNLIYKRIIYKRIAWIKQNSQFWGFFGIANFY